MSGGTRLAQQVNDLERSLPVGGGGGGAWGGFGALCLKVWERELTFDVLIEPALDGKQHGCRGLLIQHLARFLYLDALIGNGLGLSC